jgi:hypothetical protein
MSTTAVKAPGSLLLDPTLSPSAKLIWLVSSLQTVPVSRPLLQSRSGLSVPTITKAQAQLGAAGWYSASSDGPTIAPSAVSSNETCLLPSDLLEDLRVGIRARVLYGVLQLTPGFRKRAGHFTYVSLSHLTGAGLTATKHAVAELVKTGWLQTVQANKHSPVKFSLGGPKGARGKLAVAEVRRRLQPTAYGGETLMREYLSLLIDSEDYIDNATPGFLRNPFTNEFMELDRYYSSSVAFEFNGAQHYTETELSTAADLRKQQARDYMKEGFCRQAGVTFVIVHAEDLSLAGMQQRIPTLLPLRKLSGHGRLVEILESRSDGYRRAAERDQRAREKNYDRQDG